jgi:hypothetical protein
MERFRLIPILATVMSIAALCAPMAAQKAREYTPDEPKVKEIHPVDVAVPFANGAAAGVQSIEFRTAEQMTQKDRTLETDAESSINEHAGWMDLEFNQGQWTYEQVVCPALPNHMFLRFKRNNGTGDVSMFSASIPRSGDGRVRIIPIQMRGYSLFSPAPINTMTISAFNHIRAEEHFEATPEWLGTGLCYAALAGGHPQIALMQMDPNDQKFPVAMPAMMEIPVRGGAVVSFADVSAVARPMEWTMTFDGRGKLLKASHRPAEIAPVKQLHPKPSADFEPAPPAQVMENPAHPDEPQNTTAPTVPQADLEIPIDLLNLRADRTATIHRIPLADQKNQYVHPIPLADPTKATIHPVAQTDSEKQPGL